MSIATALAATLLVASSTVVGGAPAGARPGAEEASGRYIVVLRDHVGSARDVADEHATTMGAEVGAVYSHALQGYAATLTPAEVARLEADRRVAYVERDRELHLFDAVPAPGAPLTTVAGATPGPATGTTTTAAPTTTTTTAPAPTTTTTAPATTTTTSAPTTTTTVPATTTTAAPTTTTTAPGSGPAEQKLPTGIRRVGANENPLGDIDGQDDVRVDVDVAVIDSGVFDHPDLNVASRADCSLALVCTEGEGDDDNGHGTHVAGTIGALDNGKGVVGVAPGARIHSIKVCNASGMCLLSAIVAGVDRATKKANEIEVVNMSLGGRGTSRVLGEAITKSVNAGVVHVVAAGNANQDAADYFPASHDDVIAVSALADSDGKPGGTGGPPSCRPESEDDHLAHFSNYGDVVDMAAPGVCIQSTWNDGKLESISGTSMASPHVAGAAALLASGENDPTGRLAVQHIKQELRHAGTREWVDSSGDDIQEPLLDVTGLD